MAYTEKEEEFYQWMRGRFPDFNLADASLFAQFLADIRAEREEEPIGHECPYCKSSLKDEHQECFTCLSNWANAFSH